MDQSGSPAAHSLPSPRFGIGEAQHLTLTAGRALGTDSVGSVPSPGSDDMAAGFIVQSGDARKHLSTPQRNGRPENQRPMNTQLCRNGPQCREVQEGEPDLTLWPERRPR